MCPCGSNHLLPRDGSTDVSRILTLFITTHWTTGTKLVKDKCILLSVRHNDSTMHHTQLDTKATTAAYCRNLAI